MMNRQLEYCDTPNAMNLPFGDGMYIFIPPISGHVGAWFFLFGLQRTWKRFDALEKSWWQAGYRFLFKAVIQFQYLRLPGIVL